MKIEIDIPDRLLTKAYGVKDIRIQKADNKIIGVITDDYERPYYTELEYKIIEEGKDGKTD